MRGRRARAAEKKERRPQVPCGAVFVDPPITGVPHARVSDPTARRRWRRVGLRAPERMLAPWQVDIGPTKNVAPSRTPQRSLVIIGAAGLRVKPACRQPLAV